MGKVSEAPESPWLKSSWSSWSAILIPETKIWNNPTRSTPALQPSYQSSVELQKSKYDFDRHFQRLSFVFQGYRGQPSKVRVVRALGRQQSGTLSIGMVLYAGLPFSCLHVLLSGRAQPLKTTEHAQPVWAGPIQGCSQNSTGKQSPQGTMKKNNCFQIFHSNWRWSSLSLDLAISHHVLMTLFDHGIKSAICPWLVQVVVTWMFTMLTFGRLFVHGRVNFGSNHTLLSAGGQHSTLEDNF